MGLRDNIARALFEKDSKHMTGKQSEWAWQNLLLREETDSYWHGAADAVLAVLDLDTERAEAQVEALREAADSLNTGFQDIPAWAEAYEEGVRTPEWMAGGVRMVRSAIDVLTARADRIAREAGTETGERND